MVWNRLVNVLQLRRRCSYTLSALERAVCSQFSYFVTPFLLLSAHKLYICRFFLVRDMKKMEWKVKYQGDQSAWQLFKHLSFLDPLIIDRTAILRQEKNISTWK
ncbi:hypothetical protein KIN20_018478 [Parelaphostrongylus tenuis]|uniref:Uncharacterized protein n=1 Tax=Parelaphostrongylus tenuis TaxID=148309 RepID=A0AAD5QS75_PARTN|nr:hypothetical protein KIN20_018478 [Parelaphostrongylus tenuis]